MPHPLESPSLCPPPPPLLTPSLHPLLPRELDEANCTQLLQEVRGGCGAGGLEAAGGGVEELSGLSLLPFFAPQETISENEIDQNFLHLFQIVAGGEVRHRGLGAERRWMQVG